MRNWIRRLTTLVLPALMIMLTPGGAEARFSAGGYPGTSLNSFSAPAQSGNQLYGALQGGSGYGNLPQLSQTGGSTAVPGYGGQTSRGWDQINALLGGGGGPCVGPYCPRGAGGASQMPYFAAEANGQGLPGTRCPNCPGGNCAFCPPNGAQQYAAAGGENSCPWCVNGNCNCGPNCQCGPDGNCNCGPDCNCCGPRRGGNPWQNQGQVPFGGEQLAQAAYGQAGAQTMQGLYGFGM